MSAQRILTAGWCALALAMASAAMAAEGNGAAAAPVPQPAVMAPTPMPAENSLGLSAAPAQNCDDDCDFCGTAFCGPPGRFWVRGDYVYWYSSGMNLPALVTTGPQNVGLIADTDPAGSLGRSDTTVLFGNNIANLEGRSGFRISTGFWFDACHTLGIEGDYLDLGPLSTKFRAASDANGSPVLTRPYYDVQNAREWRQLVSYPGTLSGSVSVDANEYFNSAGVALRKNCCCCAGCNDCGPSDPCGSGGGGCEGGWLGNGCRLDLLAGYRYYGLNDDVTIREDLLALSAPLTGTRIRVTDTFRARNEFHGGELGLSGEVYRGRVSLNLTMKAAIGNNRKTVVIGGQTITSNAQGQSITQDAGVYAVRTNIGTYTRSEFTVIPQIGLEAGFMITPNWRAFTGYNLIYWAAVQRAGDAIDLNVDPRNIPGGVQDPATHFPQFKFCGSSFWAQGISSGLEYRF